MHFLASVELINWLFQSLEAWPHHSWWKKYEACRSLLSSSDLRKVCMMFLYY